MSASLELERVVVHRDDPALGARQVVRGCSLTLGPGETVFLAGPNGAGKTSLMLAVVGAVPSDGVVRVAGTRLSRATLSEVRRRVAFVFADPRDQLFCDTVAEEVAFGLEQRHLPAGEVARRVAAALAAVGLTGFEPRAPGSLSQGEQRRLSLATAVALSPDVVLCDEPTASLDPLARRAVLETLARLDGTLLIATHDLDAALELGARVVLMKDGGIVADGPAETLLTDAALLHRAGLAPPPGVSRFVSQARKGA